jgi:glycolate oxidase FAD binding subunit
VRDFVLGASMLNGQGLALSFGGQVMKNVAGYDVSRLLAGSWGTLGCITEVSLKVLPVAPAEATLRFELPQAEALARLHRWGGQPLPLNASCWVDDGGVPTLYVRLRGAVAAVESACRQMGGERLDLATTQADWHACRDQQLPWFQARPLQQQLWRLSVPQTAPVLDGPAAPLVEWHGGQRWYVVDAQDTASATRLRQQAVAVGGSAVLWHAGAAPAAGRLEPLSAPLATIHRALKREFDPGGILNRGRLYADW